MQRRWPPVGCCAPRPLGVLRSLARPVVVEFQTRKIQPGPRQQRVDGHRTQVEPTRTVAVHVLGPSRIRLGHPRRRRQAEREAGMPGQSIRMHQRLVNVAGHVRRQHGRKIENGFFQKGTVGPAFQVGMSVA